MKSVIEETRKLWQVVGVGGIIVLLGIILVIGAIFLSKFLGLYFESMDILLLIITGILMSLLGVLLTNKAGNKSIQIKLEGNKILIDTSKTEIKSSTVELLLGRIDKYRCSGEQVVGLPVNKDFKDQCIKDEKSSSGAYVKACLGTDFDKHYDEIMEKFSLAERRIGYAHLCRNFLDKGDNILFVAVTEIGCNGHIITTQINVTYAVQELIKECRKHKFNEIIIPVFGTGHGGLSHVKAIHSLINGALSAYKNYSCNNMKLTVIVYEKAFNDIKSLYKELKDELASC